MMPNIIDKEQSAAASASTQLQRYRFHQRRIVETRLCVGIGLLLGLLLLGFWHLRLQHRIDAINLEKKFFGPFTSDTTDTLKSREQVVKQYQVTLQTVENQKGCMKDIFHDLDRIFPSRLAITSLQKTNEAYVVHGRALALQDVAVLLQKITETKRYHYQLLEMQNANNNNNFTIELKCVVPKHG